MTSPFESLARVFSASGNRQNRKKEKKRRKTSAQDTIATGQTWNRWHVNWHTDTQRVTHTTHLMSSPSRYHGKRQWNIIYSKKWSRELQKKRQNSGSQSLLKTKQKGCDSHLQSHWWMKTDGKKKMAFKNIVRKCVDTQLLDSFCLTLRWNDVQIDGQQQERQYAGCRGHHHFLLLELVALRNVILLDLSLSSLWCSKPKKEKKKTRVNEEREAIG